MRVPYLAARATQPIPTLAGSYLRFRPILPVRITGPRDTRLRDALIDTGADDTVFEEVIASLLGVDLNHAEERPVGLVGRPTAVRCRYAPVQLRISDGNLETYEWTAVVGFVATRLRYNLLGHAGFLQFFHADFRNEDREVILSPNRLFPGRRI